MKAAIYCRLSKEDREKNLESESIQNQKALLLQYAQAQDWQVYDIYCDEDYSGADRDRPAFKRLLRDGESRRYQVLLVKTQSRFTRDMELVEKYIHNEFLLWGIRFIAVLDHTDTGIGGGKKARQINGLVNEWYLEDLSDNIRAVLDMKRKAGKYIGSFPVYGYRKDPGDHNHLVADEEAAGIVREIFRLCLSGCGKQRIAALLNRQGVPNPTRYKQEHGLGYVNGSQQNELGLWSRTTVGRILKNRMYVGDMVQGTRRKVSYKNARLEALPPEDWIVVPQTHEALIAPSVFEAVEAMLRGRTRSGGSGEVHSLGGLARCAGCGSTLCKVSSGSGSIRRSYLRCKLHAVEKSLCTSHAVRLDTLENAVAQLLRECLDRYFSPAAALRTIGAGLERTKRNSRRQETAHGGREALAAALEQRKAAVRSLYLDKTSGLLSPEQFRELNEAFLLEIASLETRLAQTGDSAGEPAVPTPEPAQNPAFQINELLHFSTPPRELAVLLIGCLEVGERDPETGVQPLTVRWRF